MISITTITTLLVAKNAFFFFFHYGEGESQEDHDKKIEDFLNSDGFNPETIRDVENSFYLKELQRLKDSYRENYYGDIMQIKDKMSASVYNQLNRIFKQNRIQISRLRLLIQPDTIISVNKSSNKEHKYSVMRGYWIDKTGKKVLKFSLSLGNTSNLIYKNGEYDEKIVIDAVKEIKSKSRELYVETYGEIK